MEIRLQKWGNSDGIRIPSSLLKELNIKTNDKLELVQSEDKIIIFKSKNNSTLQERIEQFNKLPIEEQGSVVNYDWGKPLGREIW